jgi:hypothetical protein
MQLHRHLRHLEPNIVVIFPELNDHRNYLADEFQYRSQEPEVYIHPEGTKHETKKMVRTHKRL